MTTRRLLFFALVVCLLFASCKQSFQDPKAFAEFIRSAEYPYVQDQIKGGFQFKLRYVTPDELALKGVEGSDEDAKPDKDVFAESRTQYAQSVCLQLNISHTAQAGQPQVFPEHLLLNMDGNVTLQIDDLAPIEPTFVHPERTFGLGSTATVALVFPNEVPEEDDIHLKLLIHEFGLETGDLNFELDIDRNYPSLRL